MPFTFGAGRGGFRIPSKAELEAAGAWLDSESALHKAATDGKPISPFERKILRKLGTVFSPSSLLANVANHGALENPRGAVTHRLLREAAEKSIIDALIISARLHQVAHVAQRVIVDGKQKGFQVKHKRESDPSFKPDQSVKERCIAIEEFLMRPRSDVHPGGLRDFLLRAVEGELILDRKVMIVERDRRFRPLKFHLIPPDDVKPRPEVLVPLMAKMQVQGPEGERRVSEMVYRHTGVDISDAAYIQEIDGQVVGAWRAEECAVDVTLPSSRIDGWFYGRSCLERSLALSTMLMLIFHYNEAQFTVQWPEAILALKGEVGSEDLDAFRNQIYAHVGQQGNQRLPVIAMGEENNGAELLKLRDTLRDMQYAEQARFCICLKAAAYRAHPSLLSMAPDSGSVAPLISNADQETTIALSQEEGLHSLLNNLSGWLTRELVEPLDPELQMVFSVRDLPSPQEQIAIWEKKLQNGYTVDEFRASQGDVPLIEATNGRVTGDYVNSQFFFEQQQAAQAEMQTQLPTAPDEGAATPDASE